MQLMSQRHTCILDTHMQLMLSVLYPQFIKGIENFSLEEVANVIKGKEQLL